MKGKQLMLGLCSFVRDTSDFFLSQIIVFERWKNTSSSFYPMSWLQTQKKFHVHYSHFLDHFSKFKPQYEPQIFFSLLTYFVMKMFFIMVISVFSFIASGC